MTRSRTAFTLVEILIAVMLAGMLMSLALAPVAITVRRVVETQEEYSDFSALSRTMSFIERDLSSAMRMAPNVITVMEHEAVGGNDDDVLMFMSTSPSVQNMPAGTIVYRIAEGGIMHNDVIPGLYRWIFPGQSPNAVKVDSLNAEEAQLVLPDVNEFRVEVPVSSREDDRKKDYSGQLPPGIYIKIGRREDNNTYALRNESKNEGNSDELESIIVFP